MDEDNQSEIISNYTDIDKITCPDDLTVKIKLKQVNVAFPDYMSIGILPKHLLEGEDLATCDFNQNPVGAGPYKMKEWDTAQSITMEKFDGYYNGEPNIGTVVFKIVPDTDAKAMQLKSGISTWRRLRRRRRRISKRPAITTSTGWILPTTAPSPIILAARCSRSIRNWQIS